MLTETQLSTLITELRKPAYLANLSAGKYAAIATTLNARSSIPNPTPQPTRAKLITWDTFMGLMTAADVLKMFQQGVIADHLKQALEQNNRPVTLAIWRGLKTLPLQAASITAVEAEAAKTEADPTWPATVPASSIAMNLGLPTVQEGDVRAAARRIVTP